MGEISWYSMYFQLNKQNSTTMIALNKYTVHYTMCTLYLFTSYSTLSYSTGFFFKFTQRIYFWSKLICENKFKRKGPNLAICQILFLRNFSLLQYILFQWGFHRWQFNVWSYLRETTVYCIFYITGHVTHYNIYW